MSKHNPHGGGTLHCDNAHALGCTASRSDSVGGLGDIEFWAVALSWSALNNDLHVNFCGGIYAPTGAFHNNRLANQALGYWTFEPGVMVSYLSQKNGTPQRTTSADSSFHREYSGHLAPGRVQDIPWKPGTAHPRHCVTSDHRV